MKFRAVIQQVGGSSPCITFGLTEPEDDHGLPPDGRGTILEFTIPVDRNTAALYAAHLYEGVELTIGAPVSTTPRKMP